MKMLSHINVILVALLLAPIGVRAASLFDTNLYSDLSVGQTHDLAGFIVTDLGDNWDSLTFRYGGWTGTPATIELVFVFNGVALAPEAILSTPYYFEPGFVSYNVSSLVKEGNNTVSVHGSNLFGGPATYAVGEATLRSIPVPAAALLLGSALLGLGAIKRKNA